MRRSDSDNPETNIEGGDFGIFAQMLDELKSKAPDLECEVNNLIEVIWKKIQKADSKTLLMISTDIEKMGNFEFTDDVAIAMPNDFPSRPTEYIQSVIASSGEYCQKSDSNNVEALYMEILADIDQLAKLTQAYILSWACTLDESIEDIETRKLVVEAQEMYLVRGERYQIFQRDFYEPLLYPHDNEFRKLFGITASEVVSGLMALENALSQGRIDGINVLGDFFDRFVQGDLPNPEDLPSEQANAISNALFETFSVEHFDVARITKWPETFIKALTYKPGDAKWFEQGRYKNWPIVSLPIKDRPFIMLGEKYYCFDYYSLMDNFYRVIRKVLIQVDPDYEQSWQAKQKEASENLVSNIFSNLMPNCACHTSNYYSSIGKRGHLSENDLLICFSDAIIIVEIKAGSFTYAPPITDWDKHVRDYKSLIEKADHQCAKIRKYLNGFENEAPLYDSHGVEKTRINMSKVTDIFEITVTIDDINAFASKAERLNFLNLESGAISISINDLMVYDDYFESPYAFLHFLKQRRQASRNRKLAFNDELDHLGMYIDRNLYAINDSGDQSYDVVFVVDYRDDLNSYYSNARTHGLDIPKPHQDLPPLYLEILNWCGTGLMDNPVQFTSFLLDLSSETRLNFSNQVNSLLDRARERHAAQIINLCGNPNDDLTVRLSCFVTSEDNQRVDLEECREYASSMLLANKEPDRNLLILAFDNEDNLLDIHFECLKPQTINPSETKHLLNIGNRRAQRFVDRHIEAEGKIGRNEPCPCGSGLKYKKCHGR